ncbi:unnamed protein product [Owenia fusiformis]|uniref:Josephin-2 n=1 Tax=Owenia fusiformis TaxID=6347 RepID=A0A8J1U732_OWEFU|nr:unnamed protein product [Owenia fusiformis]
MGTNMTCVKKDPKVAVEDLENVYHEKQVKELCALHTLNNLMQEKIFSKVQLDELCHKLSPENWINPHRSVLGFGNYDINVIMAALQTQGLETIWFDKRKDVNTLRLDNIRGFILNIPTEYKWGFITLPIHRKHWISICQINNKYFNLDSKLDNPEKIGQAKELRAFLTKALGSKDKELFVVITEEVAQGGIWRQERVSNSNSRETIKSTSCSSLKKAQIKLNQSFSADNLKLNSSKTGRIKSGETKSDKMKQHNSDFNIEGQCASTSQTYTTNHHSDEIQKGTSPVSPLASTEIAHSNNVSNEDRAKRGDTQDLVDSDIMVENMV